MLYTASWSPSKLRGLLYLDDNKITSTNTVRDLGVMMDSCLKFHDHTNVIAAKANRILGLISKTFQYRESDMITKLYKSLIRPMLEYKCNLGALLYHRPKIY